MPFAINEGCRIYWRIDGADDRPPLVLLNSIGTDMSLWAQALPHLLPIFQVLRIDTRGHGASDAPGGDYSLATLAADVLAAMDAAGVDRAAIAGVSLGGMIAMEIALRAPERVTHLIPVCTSAMMDSGAWSQRVEMVRTLGIEPIVEGSMGRFLSPDFAATHPEFADGIRNGLLRTAPAGYAGAGAAIRDMALLDRLPSISMATLVVAGNRDVSTPFEGHGDRIAAAIRNAQVLHLDVAHLAAIEAPTQLAAAIRRFVIHDCTVEKAERALFDEGLVHRRRVLGDDWVDRSLSGRTPFNSDFQAMITRIAWNEIWGRPGLDDRTRRLIVLAITCALGRWEEFNLHVRAGLEQRGFSRDDLKELLMQTAIYAGVPAANTGFAEAARIIAELDEEQ